MFYKPFKLINEKLRCRYKELHKNKALHKMRENALKNNMFVLTKKNGEKVRNPKIDGLTVEFYGENSVLEI